MNIKIKNRIRESGNAILFIAIFCFTLELLARIDDKIKYDAPFFEKYSSERLREYDVDGVRRNIPNERFEKWRINNLGFRGHDIDLDNLKEKTKIVCMGASETFGLYESENMEWPVQMERMLGDKYAVINASVVGQFLDKWKSYIDKYVLNLKPEIIILHVNPFNYGPEGLGKNDKAEGETKNNLGADHGKIELDKNIDLNKIKIFIKAITECLRIFPKAKQMVKRALPEFLVKSYQLRIMKKQISEIENKKLNGQEPVNVLPQSSIEKFHKDLSELIIYLKSKNIKVIIGTYPMLLNKDNIDQYPEIFNDFRRFYVQFSFDGLIDSIDKLNIVIKTVAQEYNVVLVDTGSLLSKNIDKFGDNVHYTDKGAEAIASLYFKSLLNNASFY